MPLRRVARIVGPPLAAVRRLIDLDFSPRLPPWSRLRRPDTSVQRLRAAATRLGPLGSRRWAARLMFFVAAVVWHLRAPFDALREAVRQGRGVRESGGPGRLTQIRESVQAAYAWNVTPRTYFSLRLWEGRSALSVANVVQDAEIGLHQMVANQGLDVGRIADKDRFSALCRSHGLSTTDTLRVLRGARSDRDAPLPRQALFFKPLDGSQGLGAQRWRFDPGTETWTREDRRLDARALLAHIDSVRDGRTYLMQRCLRNHPEIERFCGPTLSSFRIMTRVDGAGSVSAECVVLKIGRHGAEVDNRHAGGIVCAIDPDTGRVSPGYTSLQFGPVVRHPDSGVPIEGQRITVHRDAIELAFRAHRTLVGLPRTVGWDIAATPDGPVIIEANSVWGAGAVQWALQGPLPAALIEPYLEPPPTQGGLTGP